MANKKTLYWYDVNYSNRNTSFHTAYTRNEALQMGIDDLEREGKTGRVFVVSVVRGVKVPEKPNYGGEER